MKNNDMFGAVLAIVVVILVIGAVPAMIDVMNYNMDTRTGADTPVETASYIIY